MVLRTLRVSGSGSLTGLSRSTTPFKGVLAAVPNIADIAYKAALAHMESIADKAAIV